MGSSTAKLAWGTKRNTLFAGKVFWACTGNPSQLATKTTPITFNQLRRMPIPLFAKLHLKLNISDSLLNRLQHGYHRTQRQ